MRELKPDEYIDVAIPRYYWMIPLILVCAGVVLWAASAVATEIFHLPWLDFGGEMTIFELGSIVVVLLALLGMAMFFVGVFVFPKSICSKPQKEQDV